MVYLEHTARRGVSAARKVRNAYLTEGSVGVLRRSRNWYRRRRAGVLGPALPSRWVANPGAWPMSVLSLAEQSLPQCHHYRVEQKRQILEGMGIPFTELGPGDAAEALSRLQLARLLIIYRLPESREIEVLIDHAHRLGVPVVYELDDIVHRPEVTAANPNLETLPRSLRSEIIRGSRRYGAALRLAQANLASTAALAADMSLLNRRPGYVLDNGIDDQMLAIASELGAAPVRTGEIVVTYGSGSRAHDHDFALAAPALARWLQDTPEGRLKVIGPVRIPPVLQAFTDRTIRIPGPLPYAEYLRELHDSTVSIAPLTDDVFNRYKSQVKYLESGLLGVPLIASPTVYENYVKDGLTAVIARDEQQWYHDLKRLSASPEVRVGLATAAREHVGRWELGAEPTQQMQELLTRTCAWTAAP